MFGTVCTSFGRTSWSVPNSLLCSWVASCSDCNCSCSDMTSARSGAGGAATAPQEKSTFTSPSIYEIISSNNARGHTWNTRQCQGPKMCHNITNVEENCVIQLNQNGNPSRIVAWWKCSGNFPGRSWTTQLHHLAQLTLGLDWIGFTFGYGVTLDWSPAVPYFFQKRIVPQFLLKATTACCGGRQLCGQNVFSTKTYFDVRLRSLILIKFKQLTKVIGFVRSGTFILWLTKAGFRVVRASSQDG